MNNVEPIDEKKCFRSGYLLRNEPCLHYDNRHFYIIDWKSNKRKKGTAQKMAVSQKLLIAKVVHKRHEVETQLMKKCIHEE